MNEETPFLIAELIVGLQLALPLVVGTPAVLALNRPDKARRRAGGTAPSPDPGAGTRVAPLHCPSCAAAVPLLAERFPCPFCQAAVEPPGDYRRLLVVQRQVDRELARAERMWRRSRWSSAPAFVWLTRITIVLWSVLVLGCGLVLSDRWSPAVLFLALLLVFVQGLVGQALASALGEMRRVLPPLPPGDPSGASAAGTAACGDCGAPIAFEAGRLSAPCGYCSAQTYREALARDARAQAEEAGAHAHRTLLEAAREVRARRQELTAFLGFMAIAEVFYGALLGLAAAWGFIFG